ncbi:hypothetical protein BWI93_17075 [Siphonobacter sp. BAB-5385]|uniref:sensor histidine kinase n=2 Tax=unclassified Siphonobacter TaxID=2635712 RepID=UPI000B9E6E91|nr:histidine kinase [Siphonobacter sp. BAB-5385]OZI07018.1 hypothetical protein BWI93_17075 [Siphonobacter sp. BAB-5385]
MKRSQLPLIFVLVWFISTLYLLTGAIVFNRVSLQSILLIVSSQLLQMGVILASALYIFPRYLKGQTLAKLFGSIGAVLTGFVLTRYGLEEILLVDWLGLSTRERIDLPFFIYENMYYSFPGVFIGFIIYLLTRSYATQTHNQQLAQELRQAELSLLKSQLNPHFLYNTLNYLYAMALPLPGPLAPAVMKLSKTLQYTLTRNRREQVSLEEEIQFIQDYLSLYQLRFSPAFHYQLRVEGPVKSVEIPPLLLLPFIENVLKHGVTNDPEFPISITLTIRDSQLLFQIRNRVNRHSQLPSTGIGLENVKRRLALLYADRHALTIRSQVDTFHVSLMLSL